MTFTKKAFALGSNPQLTSIVNLERNGEGTPDEIAKLQRATKNTFGAGVPWRWALENEGLSDAPSVTCADCADEGTLSASLCPRSLFGGVVLCDECEEGRRDAEEFARENAEVVGARGPQLNLACFPGLDIHHDAAGNLVVSGL